MKLKFLTLFLFLSMASFSKEVETVGFFVTKTNDTIKCKFSIPLLNYDLLDTDPGLKLYMLVDGIKKINAPESTQVLLPDSIKGFELDYKNVHYKFVSIKDTDKIFGKEPYIFLQMCSEGYLKWYIKHGFMNNQYSIGPIEFNYLKKEDQQFVEFSNVSEKGFNFIGRLSEYFSDYPDLSGMIKNREFKKDEIGKIIKIYNDWKDSGIFRIDTTIYSVVDEMPFFESTHDNTILNIKDYFGNLRNVNCPSKTKVFFQAVVERTGQMSNIKLLKGIKDDESFNNSLLNKVKAMKNWRSGYKDGKIVRVLVNFYVYVN